jgi:hypothetical protein
MLDVFQERLRILFEFYLDFLNDLRFAELLAASAPLQEELDLEDMEDIAAAGEPHPTSILDKEST